MVSIAPPVSAAKKVYVEVDGRFCNARVESRGGYTFVQARKIADCLGGAATYWHDYRTGEMHFGYGPFYMVTKPGRSRLYDFYDGSPLTDPDGPTTYDFGPSLAAYESEQDTANMIQSRILAEMLGIFVNFDATSNKLIFNTDENTIPPANYRDWLPEYEPVYGAIAELPSVHRAKSCLGRLGYDAAADFRKAGYDAEIDWDNLQVQATFDGELILSWFCNEYVHSNGYLVTWHMVGEAREIANEVETAADNLDLYGNLGTLGSGVTAALVGAALPAVSTSLAVVGPIILATKHLKVRTLRQSVKALNACVSAAQRIGAKNGLSEEQIDRQRVGVIVYGVAKEEVTVACVPKQVKTPMTLRGSYY